MICADGEGAGLDGDTRARLHRNLVPRTGNSLEAGLAALVRAGKGRDLVLDPATAFFGEADVVVRDIRTVEGEVEVGAIVDVALRRHSTGDAVDDAARGHGKTAGASR